MKYIIGQRVLLNNAEIGTVVYKKNHYSDKTTWVYSPLKGYESEYANHNIKPLTSCNALQKG